MGEEGGLWRSRGTRVKDMSAAGGTAGTTGGILWIPIPIGTQLLSPRCPQELQGPPTSGARGPDPPRLQVAVP